MIRRHDFPKSLKIGDSIYGVRFVRVFPPAAGTVPLHGFCCYASQTLYISTGLSPKERLSTFIHEALHAIADEHDIGLTHPQVYKLEEALLRLIIDNDFIPG